MSDITPAQLGLPSGASPSQVAQALQAALKALGLAVPPPPAEVTATPFPPGPSPGSQPVEPPPAEEVVVTFRDPSGAVYTVTRS